MIERLSIRNFKSIKGLDIECRKINIFIGEPNTGKSNILEALGLLSWCGHGNGFLKQYVRLESLQNLFYDEILDDPVEIIATSELAYEMKVLFDNNHFRFDGRITDPKKGSSTAVSGLKLTYQGDLVNKKVGFYTHFNFIKFLKFSKFDTFPGENPGFLMPPSGDNLFSVVMHKKKLRETISQFFSTFGLRVVFRPQHRSIEVQKIVDDIAISYPYSLTSETLQRIIFHVIAMESNENSTLVFEEPDAHAFPYYTKYLGERIAFDESNQYFIATHNPYLLASILEKSGKHDVCVFITYYENYETKVKPVWGDNISELLSYDPFFNIDRFIELEENA